MQSTHITAKDLAPGHIVRAFIEAGHANSLEGRLIEDQIAA